MGFRLCLWDTPIPVHRWDISRNRSRAGVIGMGFTNASPIVAAPGGKTRTIGKNYNVAAGEPIPEGWAMDKDGHPTTDPEAALQGSLVSMGGSRAQVLA